MLNYRAIALVRSYTLAPVLSLVLFSLTSCKTPQSQPPNLKVIAAIEVMQQIDTQSKTDGVININQLIPLVAKATTKSAFSPNPSLFWLGSGVVLCLLELFLPKTFKNFKLVPLSLGIISLILGFSLLRMTRFVAFRWQVAYWMVLSTASVIWIRPMLLKRKKFKVPEATEARTLTEILPGETGRVLYEGSSWAARCQERQMSIPVNQTVYVVGQDDNTLIVLPEHLFRA